MVDQANMIKTEIIEYAIENAIKPGDFIDYNEGWSFISGLEKVKEQIDGVANKQPLQAVDLIETFIAVCYEKAEEIDDSSGSFGMFVEELFCSWVNARQKGKCDPKETVDRLLSWMDDDDYGFTYQLEKSVSGVLSSQGLKEFIAWSDPTPKTSPSPYVEKERTIVKKFNSDGRIGGNGELDGGFTALIVKGGEHAALRYQWNNTEEFGRRFGGRPDKIRLYIDSLNQAEASKPIWYWKTSRDRKKQNVFRPTTEFELKFDTPLAMSIGVFTKKSDIEEFRAYTNPIWIVPVDINTQAHISENKIDTGMLRIKFKFEMSMNEKPYKVMLMPLNDQGKTSGQGIQLVPDMKFGKNGWGVHETKDGYKIKHGVY